jgi:hypothetical protein
LIAGIVVAASCVFYPPWNDEPWGKAPPAFVGYSCLFAPPESYPWKDYIGVKYTEQERDQLETAREWQSWSMRRKVRSAAQRHPTTDSLWEACGEAHCLYYYLHGRGSRKTASDEALDVSHLWDFSMFEPREELSDDELSKAKDFYRVVDSVMQESCDTSWVTGHEVTKYELLMGYAVINYHLLWTQLAVIIVACAGLLVALKR